jgi:hypothetical protein
MSAPGLSIHPGVTIGPGVTLAAVAPIGVFTLSPSDFPFAYVGAGIVDLGGSTGFVSDGAHISSSANYGIARLNLYSPKMYEILGIFSSNSLSTSAAYGYIFNVSGAAGSSITKVILGLDTNNFIIAPVTTTNNDWQNQSINMDGLTNATGTLIFPATFTLSSPTIHHVGGWW